MQATCARAVQIGLRSLAFTEHADFTPWQLHDAEVPPGVRGRVSAGGTFLGDPLDVEGYLECLEGCRRQFPELGSCPVSSSANRTGIRAPRRTCSRAETSIDASAR